MAFFPFYMDISNKVCLVVGGGKIAFHKLKVLLEFDTTIYVIAPKINEEIYKLKEKVDCKNLNIIERKFCEKDILLSDIVIAATNDSSLNTYVANLGKRNNKLVNVVDVQEESDFIFPSIIKRGELILSISTSGRSPMFAVEIKKEVEKIIPDYYSDMIELLGEYRPYIKQSIQDSKKKNDIYKEIISQGKKYKGKLSRNRIHQIIKSFQIE